VRDPSDPIARTDPTDPIDSSDPAEPIDNAEPMDPIERADPIEPNDSAEPIEPTDNAEPMDAADRAEPIDNHDNAEPCMSTWRLGRPERRATASVQSSGTGRVMAPPYAPGANGCGGPAFESSGAVGWHRTPTGSGRSSDDGPLFITRPQ